jgi:uncharacterized iron-regulated protein
MALASSLRVFTLRGLSAVLLSVVAGCAGSASEAGGPPRWFSTQHRDHVLAGKIWDTRAGAFLDVAALERAAVAADVLLLGEVHDNLDHHALQARLVRAVGAAGRKPVLAFEMLDASQQGAIDAALSREEKDPDAIADAVDWNKRGWGPFTRYRAIFGAGLDAGMPIRAASLPRGVTAALEKLPGPVRARIERQGPLTEEARLARRKEMLESHCGELPEQALDPMIFAQRVRDAAMAERLDAAGDRGAILIAGTGHVRTDRGVPSYLDRTSRTVLAVAMVEVLPGQNEPGAYASTFNAQALPADVVVFTPAAEREDPCEEYLKRRKPPADTRADVTPAPPARSGSARSPPRPVAAAGTAPRRAPPRARSDRAA